MLMKTLFCFALLSLCALTVSSANAQTPKKKPAVQVQSPKVQSPRKIMSAKEIYGKHHNMVFTIKTDKGLGTGFQLEFGRVLTCYHVIDGAAKVTAVSSKGTEIPLERFLDIDKALDFVDLSTASLDVEGLRMGKASELAIGDPLYVIGSPEGLAQTLTEGLLSGRRTLNGKSYLQLSAAISPGSSGSPVFNRYGEVVGMVTSTFKEGQQLNFAISMDDIQDKMKYGVPLSILRQTASDNPLTASEAGNGSDELLDRILKQNKTNSTSKLGEAPDFAIFVTVDCGLGSATLSKETVENWVRAELVHSAPTAKVVKSEDQNKPLTKHTSLEILKTFDSHIRHLWVDVSTLYTHETHITTYSINVSFIREGILVSGLSYTTVWSKLTFR